MTATTSKLGADMLKDLEEIRSTLKNASCMSDYGDAVEMLSDLIDTLASQPAAIDKREALDPEQHGLPPYPKGNVVGPCVCGSWPGGECLKCRVIPAAPSVEQDERGAFVKLMGYDLPEIDGAAKDVWESQRATWLEALEFAASTSANVAQDAEAYLHLQIAEVCEDADGHKHIEAVIEDLDDLPKGMRLFAAPPAQTALTDDARECLMDVVSHHHDFRTACIEIKAANETTRSDELYWQKQIDVLDRMKAQAERALTAAQSASGDTK